MLQNKKVIYAGKGDIANFEDGVKVGFDYRVQRFKIHDDGTRELLDIIDDSRKSFPHGYGEPMEIIFGKKFKLPIWETCIRSMRLDETAEFVLDVKDILDYPFVSKQLRDISKDKHRHGHGHGHVHDDHGGGSGGGGCAFSCMGMMAQTGLGYKELDSWLAKPEPLLFTFHLRSVLQAGEYEREGWTLSPEQKLASIPSLREEGNELFRRGRFLEAETKYSEALGRLETLTLREKPGEPEWLELDRQKTPLYLNLAQIKLNQKDYYAAVEAATEALKRDPENSKALFRRAKAHTGAWNLDQARCDLELLRQVDESCVGIVDKELQNINDLQKKANDIETARFRNMFN